MPPSNDGTAGLMRLAPDGGRPDTGTYARALAGSPEE